MRSVRRRLLWTLGAGFAVLIGSSGFLLANVVADRATEEFDAALVSKARALAVLTEQERGHIEFDYVPERMPEFERSDRPEYFQFWLDDGKMLLRSRGLGTADLPREPGFAEGPTIRDAALPDGRAGRSAQLAWVPKASGDAPDPGDSADPPSAGPGPTGRRGVILVFARGRERLDGMIANVRLAILGIGGAAVALALLLVRRALASGFRPIDSIASEVAALDAERLGSHVAADGAPSELAPIVEQVNSLLERITVSLERERRFASHVAHELRTPIAELQSLAAVGVAWPEDREAVTRFFADVEDVAGRMKGLVQDLLLLARCQGGVEATTSVSTGLAEVVASAWSKVAADADVRGLRFRMDVAEDLVVETDPGKVSILFGNLVGNAACHALPGSEIRCVATRRGSRFRVEIENAAARLDPHDVDRVAEPFWRGDAARTSADHVGLGLSLVKAVADLLRMSVTFEQDSDGTFRVRVEGAALARVEPALLVPPPGPAVLSPP